LNTVLSQAPAVRPKEFIAQLTGVRAVAAMWVVAGHFQGVWATLFPSLRPLLPLTSAADLGVDLFFGLSGFILAHNYLRQFQMISSIDYRRFLGMRLARMYPVHLFTLLALLVGVLLGHLAHFRFNMPERLGVEQFLQNVVLIHAWAVPWAPSWNGPAWSISAEWFAYLLFPFLAFAVVKSRSLKVALAGALLPLFLLFVLSISVTHQPLHPLLRIACEFTSGVFLYQVYQTGWLKHLNWSAITLGLITGVVTLVFAIDALHYEHRHYPVAPLVVFFVFALAHARTGIAQLMSLSFMIFLGEASYSLYMTHDLLRMMLNKLLPAVRFEHSTWQVRGVVMATYIALIFTAAVATHLLVEVRGRHAIRKFIDATHPRSNKRTQTGQKDRQLVAA
jgi:peptidoglycan/LPS O-acetylase OafA/YrhL